MKRFLFLLLILAARTSIAQTTLLSGTPYNPLVAPRAPSTEWSTVFESLSRFETVSEGVGSSVAISTGGCSVSLGGVVASSAQISMGLFAGAFKYGSNENVLFSVDIDFEGSDASCNIFIGLDNVITIDKTTGVDYTENHIGFKITNSGGGAVSVYGSQSDGTESATSALTTISAGDQVQLCFRYNTTGSVDYWYRKTGGSWSSATNLSTHIPTLLPKATLGVSSVNTTSTVSFTVSGLNIKSWQ